MDLDYIVNPIFLKFHGKLCKNAETPQNVLSSCESDALTIQLILFQKDLRTWPTFYFLSEEILEFQEKKVQFERYPRSQGS